MRQHAFTADNYYHIYVHAVGDTPLFRHQRDYERFLCTLFTANTQNNIPRLERFTGLSLAWDIGSGKIKTGTPLVDICCFCLMKTHFHLILGERGNANISKLMQKSMTSFAKYVNIKYERRGHVFESTFHSKLLDSNEYLLRASGYIHLNPKDTKAWHQKEHQYPWSSYQDYLGETRWGSLLKNDVILSQMKNKKEYRTFVEAARSDDDYHI